MKTVYKYELSFDIRQKLELPKEAQILSVVEQRNKLVLYALVDQDKLEDKETIIVAILGTGHTTGSPFVDKCIFIGTVKMADGALMWHIFYKRT